MEMKKIRVEGLKVLGTVDDIMKVILGVHSTGNFQRDYVEYKKMEKLGTLISIKYDKTNIVAESLTFDEQSIAATEDARFAQAEKVSQDYLTILTYEAMLEKELPGL